MFEQGNAPSARKSRSIMMGAAVILSALALWLLGAWSPVPLQPVQHSTEPAKADKTSRSATARRSYARPDVAQVEPRQPEIVGVIRSSDDRALSRAIVCVLAPSEESREETQCEPTDAAGRFALGATRLTETTLLASAPGHVSRRQRLERSDGSRQLTSVEITLEPGGSEIAGSVVDVSGGPVAGAIVSLSAPGKSSTIAAVMSDAGGQFVAFVPDGTYNVIARADAYSQAARRVRSPARGVTLPLAPAAVIVGRVVAGTTDHPVASANVRAMLANDPLDLVYQTKAGADGTFRLAGLSGGGQYQLEASAANWHGVTQAVSIDVGQTSDAIVLRVFAGRPLVGHASIGDQSCPEAFVTATGPIATAAQGNVDGVVQLNGLPPGRYEVIVRCPGALVQREIINVGDEEVTRHWKLTPALSVSGRVEGPGGEPMADVMVNVSPADATSEEPSVSCSSAASGEFKCSGLGPGDYDCFLSDAMTADQGVVRVVLSGESATDVLLRAPPVGTIHVQFASAQNEGSNAFWVFARRSGAPPVQGIPRSNGFVFERMPLGRYEVYAHLPSPDGNPAAALLQHHGQTVELDLAPPLTVAIEGLALDESGAPWLDAWVSARPSDDPSRTPTAGEAPTLTGALGEFALRGLAPGRYDLQAHSASGMSVLQGVIAGSSNVVLRKSQFGIARAPL